MSIRLLNELCKFGKYDVYVLFAIARKKNNPLTSSQEIVFREIIKTKEDIARKYNKISVLAKNYISPDGVRYNFYIYVSVNARDSIKGLFRFKSRLDSWLLESFNGGDISNKVKKIDALWLSSLMNPESKSSRGLFIIDLDTKNETTYERIEDYLHKNSICVKLTQETKNGYHIITSPFNVLSFNTYLNSYGIDKVEVKKDGLLFLGVENN